MGDENTAIMERESIVHGIEWQAEHCRGNDAPVTARILLAQLAIMRSDTRCGLRLAHWPGGGGWELLGQAHAHGAWVEWLAK